MKTFDKKDLITWSNREKAVIGNEYYFADSLIGMKSCINNNCSIYTLNYIAEENICAPFHCKDLEGNLSYACILPVEAVKEEEKTYRPCKTIQEFCELVFNFKSKMSEEECVHELLGTTIHFKDKYQNEFYVLIIQIRIIDDEYLIVLNGAMFSFNELFNNYEIEINGEWKPFGVLEK